MTKKELNIKLKKCGRSRKWICGQMGIVPSTFWRKINGKIEMTIAEKEKLNSLLK